MTHYTTIHTVKSKAMWADGSPLLKKSENFLSRGEINTIRSWGAGVGSLAYLGGKNAQTGFQKEFQLEGASMHRWGNGGQREPRP